MFEIQEKIHENAIAHGWWDEPRTFGEVIALCHSELSEALEEYRAGHGNFYYNGKKMEGIAVEMADCIIRILDWAGNEGIDMQKIIAEKHDYNCTRPHAYNFRSMK